MKKDLISAYRSMAADTEREREALAWSDGLMLGETHAVEERSQTCRQPEALARFHPLESVNNDRG